jgi:cytochrome c oxidase subunit 2
MTLNRRVLFAFLAAGAVLTAAGGQASAQTATAVIDKSIKISGEYSGAGITLASKEGKPIDDLINVMHVFMVVIFGGWAVFFVYCLVKFRQRSGHRANPVPVKAKASKWSEVLVVVFEAAVLIGFSIPIWRDARAAPPTDGQNPFRVRVVGEQFAWNFQYPGADGKYGSTNPELVNTATNPLGLDRSGDGADDVVSGELRVPVNRPTIVEITAKDVIHSFFLPVMRVKQDAMPGMRIPVWFTPTMEGTFEVACAQLCGNNHYSMKALMYVESEPKISEWLTKMSAPPEEFVD